MKKVAILLLSFCLVLSLTSIGVSAMESGSAERQILLARSGSKIDQLEGLWSNTETGDYIAFDDAGSFYMYYSKSVITGEYDFDGEDVYLYYWEKSLVGRIDSDGDLNFENIDGRFSYVYYDYTAGLWIQSDGKGFVHFNGLGSFYMYYDYNDIRGSYIYGEGEVQLKTSYGTVDTGRIDSDGDMIFNNKEGWFSYISGFDSSDVRHRFLNWKDGLDGIWVHTDEDAFIFINGFGGYYMYYNGEFAYGHYDFDGEDIYFYYDDMELFGWLDSDGDIALENLDGWFTWSSTPW